MRTRVTDAIFVNEYDTVQKNQPLYVASLLKILKTHFIIHHLHSKNFGKDLIFLKKNWWWLLLIIAAITGGLISFSERKELTHQNQDKPEEPPHHIALRELERIRIEKYGDKAK